MPEHGRDGQLIRAKYPAATKRRLLSFLERRHFRHLGSDRPRTISAWPLAKALHLRPEQTKESRRRRVRELVEEARREGAPIASGGDGYHLATEVEDFAQTESFLRSMGLGRLVSAAGIRRSAGRSAADGQLRLAPPLTHHRAMAGATDFYRGPVPADVQLPPAAEDDPGRDASPEPAGSWLFAIN